jgi:hypothetical protein
VPQQLDAAIGQKGRAKFRVSLLSSFSILRSAFRCKTKRFEAVV